MSHINCDKCIQGKVCMYNNHLAQIYIVENCEQYAPATDYVDVLAKAIKTQAIKEFAERIKGYYNILNGQTCAALVAYHVGIVAEEMLRKMSED